MPVLQTYVLAPGAASQVHPGFDGQFRSDSAYVVLASSEDKASQLYVWSGEAASKKTKQRAAKQASDLVETLDVTAQREQQGQESAEFKQLWSSLSYTDTAPSEQPAEDESAAEQPAPQVEDAPAFAAPATVAEPVAPPAAAAAPATLALEPSAAPSAKGAPAEKEESVVDAPTGGEQPKDSGAEPTAAPPAKAATPAKPAPPAQATPVPAETKPAAVGNGVAHAAADAAASKKGAAGQPISPKVVGVEGEAMAKARELLTRRLSGSFVDPLHQKKGAAGGDSAQAATTYLADSAKVWGGGSTVAAQASTELKFTPLKDTFPYDELKGMHADHGIDMTRREDYLTEEEFAKVFGKDRATFKAQPNWRQAMAKKQVGLW